MESAAALETAFLNLYHRDVSKLLDFAEATMLKCYNAKMLTCQNANMHKMHNIHKVHKM